MDNKLNRLQNAVGIVYLGDWVIDILDDEQLKYEIHKIADRELDSLVRNKKSLYTLNNMLIVSLVIIAIERYDSNFYDHLYDYYGQTFNNETVSDQTINNRVREAIRKVFSRDDHTNQGDSRVINDVLKQSFVPINYIGSFFDFVYDIYKYNYDYSLDLTTESELAEELKSLFNFLFSNDEVSQIYEIKFDNSYRSYKLIKSTRDVLSDDKYNDSAVSLVINILRIIDTHFYRTEYPQYLSSAYYKQGFDIWKDNYEKTPEAKDRKLYVSGKQPILKPYIKMFDYNTKSIVIQTRRHLLNNFERGDSVEIIVRNNGKIVERYTNLVIKEVMGAIRIEPTEVLVKNFLGKLDYSVLHNQTEIYNSKKISDEIIMIFDAKGQPLPKINNYSGNVHVVTTLELINKEFHLQKMQYGNLYSGHKDQNTLFDFGTINLSYTEKMKSMIDGDLASNLSCKNENQNIKVYNTIKQLIVESDSDDKNNIIVKNFNTHYKVKPELIVVTSNGDKKYLMIDLSFLDINDGYYELKVLKGSQGTIGKFNFILDSTAQVLEVYSRSKGLEISMMSSFHDTVLSYQDNDDLIKNELQHIRINVHLNQKIFTYTNVFRNMYYRCNNKSYFYTHKLWHRDVVNEIEILNISYNTMTVKFENKNLLNIDIDSSRTLKISRERLLDIAINHKITKGIVELVFAQIRDVKIEILFGNSISKNDTGIFTENNSYFFNVKFHGQNPMEFKLMKDKITVFKKSIMEPEQFKIPISSDQLYKVVIEEEVIENFYTRKRIQLYKDQFYKFSNRKLHKSIFSIISAHINIENKDISINNATIEKITYSEGIYTAHLFYSNYSKSFPMNSLNPVKIEFITPIIYNSDYFYKDEFMVRIVDRDQDGILINERKNEIYQNHMSKNMSDADSFLIKLKREG